LAQVALSFLSFTGQNVAKAAAAAFDFTRGRNLEALLGSTVGFQLGHNYLSIS
jgi:hypothetical protein